MAPFRSLMLASSEISTFPAALSEDVTLMLILGSPEPALSAALPASSAMVLVWTALVHESTGDAQA